MKHQHALVVGGTGMLLPVSQHLLTQYKTISVVARHAKAFAPGINPIAVDYQDSQAFTRLIQAAIKEFGPIDLAVVWIHSNAPQAPRLLAELLNASSKKCSFVHVKGSTTNLKALKALSPFEDLPQIEYKQVILGAIGKQDSWRWLNNDEISQGVIEAISSDKDVFVVGDLLV